MSDTPGVDTREGRERVAPGAGDRRRGSRGKKADEEGAVLAKIAEMPESDRVMAERLHAVIKASAPVLSPKLWYGMRRTPGTARSCASSRARRSSRAVRDVRLPGSGQPRRWRDVADRLRPNRADRRRRGKDRCAGAESGELITDSLASSRRAELVAFRVVHDPPVSGGALVELAHSGGAQALQPGHQLVESAGRAVYVDVQAVLDRLSARERPGTAAGAPGRCRWWDRTDRRGAGSRRSRGRSSGRGARVTASSPICPPASSCSIKGDTGSSTS